MSDNTRRPSTNPHSTPDTAAPASSDAADAADSTPAAATPAPLASSSAGNAALPSSLTPSLEEGSKKKSRLQWDEENLISNAAEMERGGPRMKIDEPKTPFAPGSENGSSTSGSAHQSPPGSPSFLARENLVGFSALEHPYRRSSIGNASDGASSVGSGGRSVHISDDSIGASAGSSPRSKELFAARRRAHYRNEACVQAWIQGKDDENNDNVNNVDGAGAVIAESDAGHDGAAASNGDEHVNGAMHGDADDGGDDAESDGASRRIAYENALQNGGNGVVLPPAGDVSATRAANGALRTSGGGRRARVSHGEDEKHAQSNGLGDVDGGR